jgi:hypothetical protein
MLTNDEIKFIREQVQELAERDHERLEQLRAEIRGLRDQVRPIRPRTTTTVALVATDAGEHPIAFDPHLFYVFRVVDSSGQVLFRDVLTHWMDVRALNERHFDGRGDPQTPLGRLMAAVGVPVLWELSPMIPDPSTPLERRNRRWLRDYRDLGEWAALYNFLTDPHQTFATHTLIVRDGFLRSKLFARHPHHGYLFAKMWERIGGAVGRHREIGRRIYVVGIAKRSRVLDRYRMAMFLEGVMMQRGPCYVRIPEELERRVYRWAEFAPGEEEEEGESRKFVAGAMFLVRFGSSPYDPIWAVDIWEEHVKRGEVDEILGFLLGDAQAGFPRPFYPLCLQQAHERAHLAGLDAEQLQDLILEAIQQPLPPAQRQALEAFRIFAGGGREVGHDAV